jgi:hypothetical protein
MVIGITINNILRDHIEQLSKIYNIVIGDEPIQPINPFDLEKSFPTKQNDQQISEFKVNEEQTDFELNESDENFNVHDFMYQEASFEVFGRSEESVSGILLKLKEYEKKLKVKFVLLNKESPRSKCATLFFLSKNNFDFNKILFPNDYKGFWDEVDALISDDPKILKKKPKNKISIKVKNEFNLDIKSDFTIININNIKELKNIIKTIKEKI